MKKLLCGAALAASLCWAPEARAAAFTFNFCGFSSASDSCPADLKEASLTFDEVAGGDVNDYTLTVRFVGTLTDVYVDAIDFEGDFDFASAPVLTKAPTSTAVADWNISFNKVNANGCTGGGGNDKFACAVSSGLGPDLAGVNEWVFAINFAGSGMISALSQPNLRALFVDADGRKTGAILSPESNFVTTAGVTTSTPTTSGTPTTTGGTQTTSVTIPEPALLSLFGVGLATVAYRIRRKA